MIFEIEVTGEHLEEIQDIVANYNREHPDGPVWTPETWVGRQIFITLDERIDQQYVGLARVMNQAEKRVKLGTLSDVKREIRRRRG